MKQKDIQINQIIKQILENYPQLKKASAQKIDVGFTNEVYEVDEKYIIKICKNKNNENNFLNEISFYEKNQNNPFFPKLLGQDASLQKIPYMYEIIEKIKGKSLYTVWHTLEEEQREEIIKQICICMKEFHKNQGEPYDFYAYIEKEIRSSYEKAKMKSLFTREEENFIEKIFSQFPLFLKSEEFVLIHNDLHFDNIFYEDGKIKIIDFERSMYAPRDFELDIFFRMVHMPWKYASEETEKYTNSSDYGNIVKYVQREYPKLMDTAYLQERLAIYDVKDFMKSFCETADISLKKEIIKACQTILYGRVPFDELKTPEELMRYMDIHIRYGYMDEKEEIFYNTLEGFREHCRTMSISQIQKYGVGSCIEQAKLIQYFFMRQGIETKLYCHRFYETEKCIDQKIRMHCFVLFEKDGYWYHFEHSDSSRKGIHKYASIHEALLHITTQHDVRILTEIREIPENVSYLEFNQYVNSFPPYDLDDSISFNCKKKTF